MESLAVQETAQRPPHQALTDAATGDPLAISVAVRNGRLLLLTAPVVTAVAALALIFSKRGVVIETFERGTVTIANQEKLLEKYNSYSGTITALLERSVEIFVALAMQVIVLRLLAKGAVQATTPQRVGTAVLVLGAGTANGLSAVNVQVRELPLQLEITADDLAVCPPDLSTTSTFNQSFPEDRPGNPVANTILRNLILPRAAAAHAVCSTPDVMDDADEVVYRIPQYPWMEDLLPTAPTPKNMQIIVSASDAAANKDLTPGQFPMNTSVAADLLLYSLYDPVSGNAWNGHDSKLKFEMWSGANSSSLNELVGDRNITNSKVYAPTARLFGLLPPSLTPTEHEDRTCWAMSLSHVDIEPGTVWADAITIEVEVASPRLYTNTSKDGTTRYFALEELYVLTKPVSPEGSVAVMAYPFHVAVRKAGDATEDRIDLYNACLDSDGIEMLTSSIDGLTRGKRLLADALVAKATLTDAGIVTGRGPGIIVNMREIFSVTVARISWKLQNLSHVYDASCSDTSGGCMGLDVALAGGRQRLVVGTKSLPLGKVNIAMAGYVVPPIVSVRRPQFLKQYGSGLVVPPDAPFMGDLLLPHSIRNISGAIPEADVRCYDIRRNRAITYVDNHVYIESTLQPSYTAAVYFLFQAGVPRDMVNQTWTPKMMLAFVGNKQNVDVYVVIPWLNVVLTLAGCVLLVVAVIIAVLWPRIGLRRERSDPLAHITTPHTIASVMLKVFPPLLLTRSVVLSEKNPLAETTPTPTTLPSTRSRLSARRQQLEQQTLAVPVHKMTGICMTSRAPRRVEKVCSRTDTVPKMTQNPQHLQVLY